jgi:predicted MFS family arabinose efflux permease
MPPLATTLIGDHGWRTALWMHGLIWLVVVLPFVFIWFRGAHDVPVKAVAAAAPVPEKHGMAFKDGLRSTSYLRLLIASLFFTFTVVALNFQFMPLLSDWGIPADKAKWYASLIGLASIAGRLGIGWLIDRFDAARIGGMVFLLPVLSALLLLYGRDFGATPALVAILLGFTLGAEVDVIVYLTTRFFGLRNFGALYGGLLGALSIGTALGPLAASRVFDQTGSYNSFFWLALVLALVASASLFSLPKPPEVANP